MDVLNVLPAIDPIPAATVVAGRPFSQTVSFVDPAADHWSWSVDYGDGTSTSFASTAPNTAGTLAAELKPGATQIVLNDASGWYAGGTSANRSLAWLDPTGKQAVLINAWDAGQISRDVITLSTPWDGPDLAAGATVWNVTEDPRTFDLSHTYATGGNYTVQVRVSDPPNSLGPVTATFPVSVITTPVLSGIEPQSLAYTESEPPEAITNTLAVSYANNANLTSATVAITGNYQPGEDLLAFVDTSTITGNWDAATGTLTLDGTDTAADYQAALRSVTYLDTSANPSNLLRTVTFTASNGTSTSLPASRTITVTPVNNPPVVSNIETVPLAYTEKDPPTPISKALVVTDVDNTTLCGATVTISGNYQPDEDVLAFANTAAITGTWNAALGTLSLSGTDTVADYQAALRR